MISIYTGITETMCPSEGSVTTLSLTYTHTHTHTHTIRPGKPRQCFVLCAIGNKRQNVHPQRWLAIIAKHEMQRTSSPCSPIIIRTRMPNLVHTSGSILSGLRTLHRLYVPSAPQVQRHSKSRQIIKYCDISHFITFVAVQIVFRNVTAVIILQKTSAV